MQPLPEHCIWQSADNVSCRTDRHLDEVAHQPGAYTLNLLVMTGINKKQSRSGSRGGFVI